jgi:hypothetical protein
MLFLSALSKINLLAVVVAALTHMVIGLVWFQPKIFGNEWAKLTGKDLKPATQWMPAGLVAHLVMATVLAAIVTLANATTVFGGIIVGIAAWIGFIVPLETGELIWEKIPFKLFLIRVGNHLVGMSIAGIILALWR